MICASLSSKGTLYVTAICSHYLQVMCKNKNRKYKHCFLLNKVVFFFFHFQQSACLV